MKLPLILFLGGTLAGGVSLSPLLAATPEATVKAGDAVPELPGWPREINSKGVLLTIYQPQVDAWEESRLLKARAAFVMTPGKGKPAIGIMEIEGETTTDLATRTVLIRELKVTAVRFPSLPEAEVPATESLFRSVLPSRPMTVSLDRLVAGLKVDEKPLTLNMEPPRILISKQPSLLLLVEGKPVTAPAGKGQFIVNANWDVFTDSSAYYLLGGGLWYKAKVLDGDWELASTLPEFLTRLPEGSQWEHVKESIPPSVKRGQSVPGVVFSATPAELIVFDGSPVWEELPGIGLSWARNTESRVFQTGGAYYYLTSGRWFRAPSLDGPWQYAGNDLPKAFSSIPPESPCADILASVPGTPEAEDAIVLASIPREAVVKVKEAEAKANASYDGEPAFKPIEGTSMAYATNTSADVIRVDNRYYLCQTGVWFVGPAAAGPWTICTDVPAVIYTIPPTCPVYRVVYVKVEAGSSADVVVCRYTAGYEGAYIATTGGSSVLVWGTGYYYPPYVSWHSKVPVYYPYPATYGAAAVYNPWSGGYAVGQRYYGPYGSAGSAAWYNPNTGNYGRAARVTTPYGSSTVAAGYNPRTDTGWATRQNNNGYTQWGTSAVQRGDDWLRTGHAANENGAVAGWQGSQGSGHVWKTDEHSGGTARHDGDFYAGHDGNVYRRDESGDWAKYNDGNWESVDTPERKNSETLGSQQQSENRNTRTDENPGSRESRRVGGESGERKAETQRTRGGEETRESRQRQENGEQQRRTRSDDSNRTASRSGEQRSDLSQQLNRDFSNRRSGAAREQRSFEQRRSGGESRGGRSSRGGRR